MLPIQPPPLSWYSLVDRDSDGNEQKVEKQREATPAEKIAQLEEQRGGLVAKRLGLERKIRKLEMRAQGATREESMQGQERRR